MDSFSTQVPFYGDTWGHYQRVGTLKGAFLDLGESAAIVIGNIFFFYLLQHDHIAVRGRFS
jgi:hypothetical protein